MAWDSQLKEWTDFPLIEFVREWKPADRRERLRLVGVIVRRVPHMTYPLGYKAYLASQTRFGRETWWAPHNLWREVWHFGGGFALTWPFKYWEHVKLITLLIFTGLAYWEFFGDAKGKISLITKKNVFDVIAWTGGSLCLVLWF